MLSGWREHRPSYKVNRQDKTRHWIDRDSPRTATACLFVRDGSCSTRCWASKQGVHRAPRVATVLNLSTQPRASNNAHGRTHARKILLVESVHARKGSKARIALLLFLGLLLSDLSHPTAAAGRGGLDRASRRRPMPLIILGRRRLRLDRRRKAWWLPPYHFWLR